MSAEPVTKPSARVALSAPLATALVVPLPALPVALASGAAPLPAAGAYAAALLFAIVLSAAWFALIEPLIGLVAERGLRHSHVVALSTGVATALSTAALVAFALAMPPKSGMAPLSTVVATGALPGLWFGLVAGFATVWCRR